jgi:hypothetical protein
MPERAKWLDNPEALKDMAEQLRAEALRMDARAERLEKGDVVAKFECLDGCFVLRCSCFVCTKC